MTLEDVATEVERSPATMSRLERGNSAPRLVEVRALLDLYGDRVDGLVTDETRSSILDLVRDSRRDEWFNDYRDVTGPTLTSAELQRFVELETDAQELLAFESDFVPGLFQTEAYARAIVDAFRPDTEENQKRRFVQFRMERQRILDRVRVHIVISEAALRRTLGTSEVMIGQLEKLADAIDERRESVTIQVAPLSLALPAAAGGSFVVIHIDGADSDVVYLEGRAGPTYLRNPAEIDRYKADFAQLTTRVLDDEGSLKVIAEVIAEHR